MKQNPNVVITILSLFFACLFSFLWFQITIDHQGYKWFLFFICSFIMGLGVGYLIAIYYLGNTNFFINFKWYRKFLGGTWYKYETNGQFFAFYARFWSRDKIPCGMYYKQLKSETYTPQFG